MSSFDRIDSRLSYSCDVASDILLVLMFQWRKRFLFIKGAVVKVTTDKITVNNRFYCKQSLRSVFS